MIVTCPQCATQYNLPDSSVREGAKARCAQCKTIFVIHVHNQPPQCAPQLASTMSVPSEIPTPQVQAQQVPVAQQTQIPRPSETIVADGLPPLPSLSRAPQQNHATSPLGVPSFMQDSAFAPQSAAQQTPTATQYQQAPQHQPSHAQNLDFGYTGDTAALTGQANRARQAHHVEQASPATRPINSPPSTAYDAGEHHQDPTPTAFQSFVTVLLFLAIFGMLGYGAWRYMPRLGQDQLEAETNRISQVSDQIKDISLHNVRQYTVESAKAGLLLVIEGRVINNFRTPREMVKVEAALYDKDGKRLESTQQLCGVLVSKLQMQIWDASEIEAALDNELEAYAHNVNIASGTSVPFMVVFVNPPASVATYGVHVVDAQIPPSK